MNLALQSISWGVVIADLPAFLKQAKGLGFDGIEFAQLVRTLPASPRLQGMLGDLGLRLAGLAGGSLRDRAAYAVGVRPGYLYCDEWVPEEVEMAKASGQVVGLHPHFHKDLGDIEAAERHLDHDPELRLIVDTAHLWLAGDDVVAALNRNAGRIVAIHFKDWTSLYGTSPYRFARGFTVLGRGELGEVLTDCVRWAVNSNFEGWMVIEQDNPEGDPGVCAAESLRWLKAKIAEL